MTAGAIERARRREARREDERRRIRSAVEAVVIVAMLLAAFGLAGAVDYEDRVLIDRTPGAEWRCYPW